MPMLETVPVPVRDAETGKTRIEFRILRPGNSEQHAEDWSSFIAPYEGRWLVVFRNEELDLCRTREEARAKIRSYKRDPGLAVCASVQLA